MNSLILRTSFKLRASNPQIPPSNSLSRFPSRENPRFAHFFRRKWSYISRPLNVSLSGASSLPDSTSYGGWGDDGLNGEVGNWGQSTRSRNFIVSYGIRNKKNLFMFFMGFVCAWAIFRVRIYKTIMFPAYVFLFSIAIGFSFGFIRGGGFSDFTGSKTRSKDEFARVYSERLRNFSGLFDGIGVKFNNLRNSIQEAIDSNRVTAHDLENYVDAVESISLEASNAKNVVEASINKEGNPNGFVSEARKSPSKKGKENGEVRFEFTRFLGSLFGQRSVRSKSNKPKGNLKREDPEAKLSNQTRRDFSVPVAEVKVFASVNSKGVSNPASGRNSLDKSLSHQNREGKREVDLGDGKIRLDELGESAKISVDGQESNYLNKRLQFVSESDRWASHDNLLNPRDFKARFQHKKTEALFVHEEILVKSGKAHGYFDYREKNERVYRERMYNENDSFLAQDDHLRTYEGENRSYRSSKFAEDVLFDKCLAEANGLLSEAKECLQGRHDDEGAELMLKRCAKLLSEAIAMKPTSLFAIGLLGNTYLLHGELKLYISRKLRTLLSRSDAKISEQQGSLLKGLDDEFSIRDGIIFALARECEECEELLVKAGRKYMLALSIDGNDGRSLYNWGLALSFHAQLIADIGPEAASDADHLLLAAIDKFDAVMSKGNIHASDALYRWGLALQQRSRLQPSNSKEEIKLLQQAMTLYEDALNLDLGNLQVREALSSCISELKYRDV